MDWGRISLLRNVEEEPFYCTSPEEAKHVFLQQWLEDLDEMTHLYCVAHQRWEPLAKTTTLEFLQQKREAVYARGSWRHLTPKQMFPSRMIVYTPCLAQAHRLYATRYTLGSWPTLSDQSLFFVETGEILSLGKLNWCSLKILRKVGNSDG